ncbi:MAG: tetratricopeptide repeat protein [Rhodothermaceae bacterium]|nr:tetratricopeptide repeat protein [Rhodothermaceae bacterium]MXZ17572.1 tetratricopeptide repeat protein [Rhodothermaceae bacterium]MYC03763.1 tetratricopeptide repeat protein [Rhodothermaceae bacterium]MYG70327.1 tetratricopeptide repeat protein [Rhodothermaceae bacterium]MYI16052.1 tetratricopeptide repeat protein [Rhodothermaceae bacterium]
MCRTLIPLSTVLATLILLVPTVRAQATVGDQETRIHYSLYYENYKNENYRDAVNNLVWILYNAPGFSRNSDVNFRRAIETFQALADAEEDEAAKRAWLDSALVHFDRVIPVLSELEADFDPFIWTRNRGRFIQTNINVLADQRSNMIASYRGAYEMDSKRIDPYYLEVIISDLYQSGDIGGALDFLRELKDLRGDEDSIDGLIRKYFVVIPPDEQIAFLEEQYEAEPDNAELVTQLFELYQQEAYREKMLALADKVLALEPTAATLRLLTRMYVEDGDNDRAIATFQQMESIPDIEIRSQDYYNLGLAYQDMEDFRQARDYFRAASDVDPDFEPAQIAIPNLYATAVASCGVADREQAAVFWIIADQYARIGDQDGVNRMATAFPTAEDIFYVADWSSGESAQVSYTCRGMTISGTTTVRQRR